MNTTPTKPDYDHLQITLRLPNWVVTQIDGIAADEYTTRASVLRRLLAGAVQKPPRGMPNPPGSPRLWRDNPPLTASHPEPTPLLHHPHCSPA